MEQRFVFDAGIDREIEARLYVAPPPHGSCDLDYLATWLQPDTKMPSNCAFDNCIVVRCLAGLRNTPRFVTSSIVCDVASLFKMEHSGACYCLPGLLPGMDGLFRRSAKSPVRLKVQCS